MGIFSQLTDDQVALIGCGFAFAICGALLSLSYHFGQAKRREDEQSRETLTFPKATQEPLTARKRAA